MAHVRVGKRVRVYWGDEEEWFEGAIQDYDEAQGVYVVYDDGDERWEPSNQRMEVLEEESDAVKDQEPANDARTESAGRPPEMMEPPASPGSAYDDDYEGMEQEEKTHDPNGIDDTDAESLPAAYDTRQTVDQLDEFERSYQQDHDVEEQTKQEAEHDEENEIIITDNVNNDPSDDEMSVAESEIPHIFEKRSASALGTRTAPSKVNQVLSSTAPVPSQGLLVGKVLRANCLSSSSALAPDAFVRVSFVESGDTTDVNAMLRCKETLFTTNIVRGSINPVWGEESATDGFDDGRLDQSKYLHRGSNRNEGFHLQLLPRVIPPETTPAWLQLPGDILFTVYSASRAERNSRNGANEHIGQATVSLRSLLPDLLTCSPFATHVLELRSRNGRRLGNGNLSTSSMYGGDDTGIPTLVVSFRFFPTYEDKIKSKVARSVASASSVSRLSRVAPAKVTPRKDLLQDKARGAKRLAPAQTSSSAINRRRFEKKVATDNRSFAKRLEWKEGRRTRQVAEAKAQEKKKITPPQYGARKHGHKASSGINRSKYVQQVAKENKTIGKRLQNILGGDAATRNPADYSRWATAEAKDSTSYDYMDRDKAHVKDMRWQRQVELDFMMEKAQTKYQRQNQIVEEVMELQEFVAGLKSQVDALTKNVTRLNILNNKDQHVRDCLLRAAATSCGSIRKLSPRQPQTNSRGTKTKPSSVDNQEDSGSSGKVRKEQELELLMQHQERLIADKQKLSQELQSLNQQEIDLDKEINDRQAKWELAVATRLFHKQMEKKNALQAQRAAQEMMRRQKALELSREEEEQWVCYQAHQELTQLQIAIQLLRDQRGENPRRIAATRASSSSLSAVCDYLTKNIDKQKIKLKELGQEVERRRHDYEALLVNGGNEKLRKRVHELQKLVFLCKAQATHVKQAQRHAQRKSEQMELEFQRRIFNEQTETEIVFKKSQCL